ncbi:helix-turn-helix domain-containing protein [Chitinophaga sp. Ak27]|uniref:helix-turn-helix domain-containing protein n=1 Tax=Chitinophaga sp. Ak27 TaxID=2726116 RepID=UPI00145EDDC9|nr:AraC family transcriptional regulator [Chitinophaga sp. Ak27]NLU92000.1 helix-turn-helix domain-containing protein [Chitinophaga sp. Ak27]
MAHSKGVIPFYDDINEFFASTPFPDRTNDPNLFCFRVNKGEDVKKFYKPPFRRSFYFMALLDGVGQSKIVYDNMNEMRMNSTLVFQAPGLLSSFYRTEYAYGYLMYFKLPCFSFFRPDFEKQFPFFDVQKTHFFELTQEKYREFALSFEDIYAAYEKSDDKQHTVASLKILATLYQLKNFVQLTQQQERLTQPESILLKQFLQLVSDNYIEKRTVNEYAEMLSITPKYLSEYIKNTTGNNALLLIHQRIIAEAKSLVLYTNLDISEICYQLNFSDPANFNKFFKKHVGATPLEFRNQYNR